MANKLAIVTGGVRGIGLSCALRLAKSGYSIAVNDIKEEEDVKDSLEEIRALGVEAFYVKANVTKPEDCENFINKVMEKFGKIDLLVNNAGITKDNLFLRMTKEDWDAVLSINLTGAFNVTKPVVKIMMKQRSGSIVNISSVIGVMGNAGQANYAASKAGLIGLTKSLAKELATRNITVNAVAPGFIVTAMTEKLDTDKFMSVIPLKKLGTPEDVAEAVYFLGAQTSYITGQVLNVDGGLVM